MTEICVGKLYQHINSGHEVVEFLRKRKHYLDITEAKKDALDYASYYIDDHLKNFSVEDLKATKETAVMTILTDRKLAYLMHASYLKRWAKGTLFEFLKVLISFCNFWKIMIVCLITGRSHRRALFEALYAYCGNGWILPELNISLYRHRFLWKS